MNGQWKVEARTRRGLSATKAAAVCVFLVTAWCGFPALADDQAALLDRIEKMERELQRLEAMEKRIDEVCAQLDALTGQMTTYSVRQSAENGRSDTEDEAYWNAYWKEKSEECH